MADLRIKPDYRFKCPHCREMLSSEKDSENVVKQQKIHNFVTAWVCSNCENLLQITENS